MTIRTYSPGSREAHSKELCETYVREVATKYNKKANIRFKSEAWFHRAIAWFMKPINPAYMDQFVTTIGSTIWIPDGFYEHRTTLDALEIIAHETLHLFDDHRLPVIFPVAYLFPISLLPFVLILGIIFGLPWWLVLVFSLLCFAPGFAPFRAWLELRAYRVSFLFFQEIEKSTDLVYLKGVEDHIVIQFTSGNYFFMWPWKKQVRKWLKTRDWIAQPQYQEVIAFATRHGLVATHG